jgi:hypothetical protein
VARLWPWLTLTALVLVAAMVLRYQLVEPPSWAVQCAAQPDELACRLRATLIRMFTGQRLGWFALAAGVLAWPGRNVLVAGLAIAGGAAGIVLYSVEPAAAGWLLGMLARAGHNDKAAIAAGRHKKPSA